MANRSKRTVETVAWDGVVKGLGLRVRGSRATWVVQTRIDGKTVKRTLGAQAALSRPEARKTARQLIRELSRARRPSDLAGITVGEFGLRYIADRKQDWADATVQNHSYDLEVNIAPFLGAIQISYLTRVDVFRWLDDLVIAPGSKNRAMAVLSGILRHAELFDLRMPGSNPCKDLRRHRINFKATYLTQAEYNRFGAALRSLENAYPDAVALLRFLALTGARKGEARGLKWDWLDGSRFALPNSKSGPRSIWLGSDALALLNRRERIGVYVFEFEDEPITNSRLTSLWRILKRRANLPRLRIHDLRHSFASVAIGNGVGMRTIGGLLGHRDLSSTAAYARLQEDALRASVGRVGAHMSDLLAIKDRVNKSYHQMRVIEGEVVEAAAKTGPKPKPKRLPSPKVQAKRDDRAQLQAEAERQKQMERDQREAEKKRLRALKQTAMKRDRERREKLALRDALVKRYFESKLSLPEFCAREGLNEAQCREQVIAYRAERKVAS